VRDLKESLFRDEEFTAWRQEFQNPLDALESLVDFKWTLTDQLREFEHLRDEGWARSLKGLIIRTKVRIAEVKRDLKAQGLGEDVDDLLADMREERREEVW